MAFSQRHRAHLQPHPKSPMLRAPNVPLLGLYVFVRIISLGELNYLGPQFLPAAHSPTQSVPHTSSSAEGRVKPPSTPLGTSTRRL